MWRVHDRKCFLTTAGLDSKNLQVSVSSGDVMLKSLNLKKSALKDLELPIVVKEGTGTLQFVLIVRFPWAVIDENTLV
jgi:hypothetical protein